MKQSKSHIEQEVRKTLQLLDEMERIAVHPSFRVRLTQRIEREFAEGAQGAAPAWQLNYRLAFMLLLIIINIGTAFLAMRHDNQETGPAVSDVIETLGDDYSSPTFAYYDQASALSAEPVQHSQPDAE